MSERPLEAARESGLLSAGRPVLVLLSGGGDSVCLLDVALRLDARVSALHVNYGLRAGADEDEGFVRDLCSRLGVTLHVERVRLPEGGNLQERAREARYALAETLIKGSDPFLMDGDYAAAHTASDQAETVLYRLAVSPGSRALLGMAPRRGRLVRPLLGVTRSEVREYLRARGLDWREDPSNADRRFARARVRHDLLEALRTVGPAAERTIAETARQMREEAEVLDAAVSEALEELGGGPAVSLAALREKPPALRRLVLRRLAEQAAREPLAPAAGAAAPRGLSRREADEILALDDRGTKTLDLGGGLRAVAEYGTLRFTRAREETVPDPVELTLPGRVRFGDWEVEAGRGGGGDVTVSGLGPTVTVRAWREGDRMRPAGLGGTKSLQDLFTDRKVPRALRRTLPVVESAGEIVWVAGVAVDERFEAQEGRGGEVALSARAIAHPGP
jgi:tRNA(Ile)-lysidine synthase